MVCGVNEDCEKVLEDYEMKECDAHKCFRNICSEGHIKWYDSYDGDVSFCSRECLIEYRRRMRNQK